MRSLVLPWLHFWAFFPVSVISVCDPGLPDLGLLNLCLWPRPLPGIVYVSALPPIFLLCPLTIACVILPLSNKYILLHLDPLPLTSLYSVRCVETRETLDLITVKVSFKPHDHMNHSLWSWLQVHCCSPWGLSLSLRSFLLVNICDNYSFIYIYM